MFVPQVKFEFNYGDMFEFLEPAEHVIIDGFEFDGNADNLSFEETIRGYYWNHTQQNPFPVGAQILNLKEGRCALGRSM